MKKNLSFVLIVLIFWKMNKKFMYKNGDKSH